MHVQEACISVPNAAYQDRIDQVIAHIPVKSANGTSHALLDPAAYAPWELILLPAAAPEESAHQTPPAVEVPPEALVAQEDSGSRLPSSDDFCTVVWSVLTVVLLHAMVLL
jgi:hypothetical protein